MAVRGLLDYVRAVGVLVRGALINFSLGQNIGEQVLRHLPGAAGDGEGPPTAYADLDEWLQALHEVGSQDTDQAL